MATSRVEMDRILTEANSETILVGPWLAVLMSLFAGLSTVLGAALVYCIKAGPLDPNIMSFSLALAAGVMITVSIIELLPQGFKKIPGESPHAVYFAFGCSLLGALTYALISRLMPHVNTSLPFASVDGKTYTFEEKKESRDTSKQRAVRQTDATSESTPLKRKSSSTSEERNENNGATTEEQFPRTDVSKSEASAAKNEALIAENRIRSLKMWRLTLVLMISLTLHNFPEGFAVAVSAISNVHLGFTVMIAIMLHNIPEGIVIAIPAYAAHGSKSKAVMLAAASGFSEPIGALIAVLFLKDSSSYSLRYVLSYVGGMMIAVALMELIPEAISCRKPFAFSSGLICGAVVMLVTGHLIPV